MTSYDDSDVPETGAIFTFGKNKFADDIPNKFWIRNDPVVSVACGDRHTAIATKKGRVFTFGANEWGQLGLGHMNAQSRPSCVKSLLGKKVIKVACGRDHTLVYTHNHSVYAFGHNDEGQCGTSSDSEIISTPELIEELNGIKLEAIAAGSEHSLALTRDGKVYGWGSNDDGQLGVGDHVKKTATLVKIQINMFAVDIACGYYHSAVVTESSEIYVFGSNCDKQLGLDANFDEEKLYIPTFITGLNDVVTVACGISHTVACTASGQLYSWGKGERGELGQGPRKLFSPVPSLICLPSETFVSNLAASATHTAFITKQCTLFVFGDGSHGKLGLSEDSFSNVYSPTILKRFLNFDVTHVSCGGCHMVVCGTLSPVTNNDTRDSCHNLETPKLDSSYIFRQKRRDKLVNLDSSQSMRTLPALPQPNNNILKKANILNGLERNNQSIDHLKPGSKVNFHSSKTEGGRSKNIDSVTSSGHPVPRSRKIASKRKEKKEENESKDDDNLEDSGDEEEDSGEDSGDEEEDELKDTQKQDSNKETKKASNVEKLETQDDQNNSDAKENHTVDKENVGNEQDVKNSEQATSISFKDKLANLFKRQKPASEDNSKNVDEKTSDKSKKDESVQESDTKAVTAADGTLKESTKAAPSTADNKQSRTCTIL